MSIFQKLAHWLFGWQYCLLIHHDGELQVRRCYAIGYAIYATPYTATSRVRLMPGGKTKGQRYIESWEPVTDKAKCFYDSK